MNLRIPLKECSYKKYDCPCCGGKDFASYDQTNPHNVSLDICKKCGFIFRSNFLDEVSSLKHLRHYHKSLPNISYYSFRPFEWLHL